MNARMRMTFAAVMLLAFSNINAAELDGHLRLLEDGRAANAQEYADAVIFYIPETGTIAPPSTPPQVTMEMRNKAFLPRVLPLRSGTEVAFVNFDPILHNAFSTSREAPFDLGFYGNGESRSITFDTPGLIRVYCNVHRDMVAYVLVLNTAHYMHADRQGRFHLPGLPEGDGTLYVWHPRARALREPVFMAAGENRTLDFELELTERRIPRHLDKHGKSYRSPRERRY